MRAFAVSRVLLALLFTCVVSHAQVPSFHFLKVENEEALGWASQWEAELHGVAMRPGGFGIYPLDKNTVMLFGELTTPAASIRSFLLRSSDGGKTWREVMSPVYGSQVLDVFFHDTHVGWALVGWTTEGPGNLALYKSKDGGSSWRKISDIPKRHYSGWPVSMSFSDGKNGAIDVLYPENDDPPNEGLVTLSTRDGGRSWHETGRLTLDEYEKVSKEEEESEEEMVAGRDGSQWLLRGLYEETRIFRRSQADEAWRLLCVMQNHFGYSKGEVISHPVEK